MSGYPGVQAIQRRGLRISVPPAVQVSLAFLGAALFYFSLYGQLPFHDAVGDAQQLDAGKFTWDIGHIFMEPVALLWHRYLGFGEESQLTLKHINTFSTAAAVAIFYATLLRLRLPAWQRILGSALLAGSSSILILAPCGMPKLEAFPFVNAALFALIGWERIDDGRSGIASLVTAGVLLAMAGAFLASALATVPFANLAVLAIGYRRYGRFLPALRDAVVFGAVCTLVFALCAALGFALFAGQTPDLGAMQSSVALKESVRPMAAAPSFSLGGVARVVFGTVDNFVAAPHLAEDGRAYLGGQIHDFASYLPSLAWEIVPFVATLALLAVVYLKTGLALVRRQPILIPAAFLCGAQAWTIYYGMIDPEHWFQLSSPTILLYLLTFSQPLIGWTLPIWLAGTLAANLAFWAVPQATYPLYRYVREVNALYTPKDMLVYFGNYPGTHYLGFFYLPNVQRLRVDLMLEQASDPAAVLSEIKDEIDRTLDDDGEVVVYSIFARHDWSGGWAALAGLHITKAEVMRFFREHYRIIDNGEIAEMPTWRLEKK